jgi:hypothetical protein
VVEKREIFTFRLSPEKERAAGHKREEEHREAKSGLRKAWRDVEVAVQRATQRFGDTA